MKQTTKEFCGQSLRNNFANKKKPIRKCNALVFNALTATAKNLFCRPSIKICFGNRNFMFFFPATFNGSSHILVLSLPPSRVHAKEWKLNGSGHSVTHRIVMTRFLCNSTSPYCAPVLAAALTSCTQLT